MLINDVLDGLQSKITCSFLLKHKVYPCFVNKIPLTYILPKI